MTRIDRLALLVSLLVAAAAGVLSIRVYEAIPHFEDEMAYVWQARVIASGRLTVPSPQPNPNSFLVPFVVDYNGQRFSKYTISWSTILALGEIVGARGLVNPLLAGANAWFLYRLGKKLLDEKTALLAAALVATSPFFLLNSASLLSHPLSLLLTTAFIIGWLDSFPKPNRDLPRFLPPATSALALGALALTRPWTAVGVAVPFVFHGLFLFITGGREIRLRLVLFAVCAGLVSSLYFLWQAAVTGDPLLNPYTLWWPYDQVGFGPGHGRHVGGYQPAYIYPNILFNFYSANIDLFGWPLLSWIFLPFGIWATRRNGGIWLITSVTLSLIAAYALYWTQSWFFGPRYLFEGIAAPILLTASGIRWLAGGTVGVLAKSSAAIGHGHPRINLLRFGTVVLVIGLLVGANLRFFLPQRVAMMRGLFGVSTSCLTPLQHPRVQDAAPALVFVHVQRSFYEYACVSILNPPALNSSVIYAISRGATTDALVARAYPGRKVLHYYPDTRRVTTLPREIPQ